MKHILFSDFKGVFLLALLSSTLIAITWGSHVGNVSLCYMGHESHNGEDDKASKHAGEGVDAAHNDRISVGERQSTRQPLSRLYQFLISPSHIVEGQGEGAQEAILNPAVACIKSTIFFPWNYYFL